jgi:glycosyltransferase involved in cell wall biosynthesis
MRILFVVHKYPPESLGGTEIYTWSLARALTRAGHDVHVFYPYPGISQDEANAEEDGVHLWRVAMPTSPEGPVKQFWHTFRSAVVEEAFTHLLEGVRPDIVHFQHVQGVSARLIELAAGRPRIVTLHDYWYFCANSQLVRPDRQVCSGPGWGWKCVDCATARADLSVLRLARPAVALPFAYRNRYLRRLCQQVDRFLSPSEFLRRQYIAQGFPADRITMLENGLDTARLTGTSAANLPPPSIRPHFGFLGSLAWQKGVHILVDAFNQLPDKAALTIYGNEKAFPEYVAQLKAAAHHPYMRFAGQLDHRAVGAAFRQIDCLVVPSVWYENSPVTIQEAYAMQVPVIASRLGALAEKVQDGKTGRLFSAGNSQELAGILRQVIEHPDLLNALRAGIRPPPTLDEHITKLEAIYADALSRASRQGSRI